MPSACGAPARIARAPLRRCSYRACHPRFLSQPDGLSVAGNSPAIAKSVDISGAMGRWAGMGIPQRRQGVQRHCAGAWRREQDHGSRVVDSFPGDSNLDAGSARPRQHACDGTRNCSRTKYGVFHGAGDDRWCGACSIASPRIRRVFIGWDVAPRIQSAPMVWRRLPVLARNKPIALVSHGNCHRRA
jgi:hypothetical protein